MLYIRFDRPPSHESGRFIEVERDGVSVSYGEWKQDGDDWLFVIPDTARLEAVAEAAREAKQVLNDSTFQWIDIEADSEYVKLIYKQDLKRKFLEAIDNLNLALEALDAKD